MIRDAIAYGSGIRILNQEKWETLISFIISQNNNIPRIKKCINSLAENFGQKSERSEERRISGFRLPKGWLLSPLRIWPCAGSDTGPVSHRNSPESG